MTERRWTVTSSWMMTYEPEYLKTANFFGEEIGLIDLDFEPKKYPNDEILWCISVTYLRQDSEKFGELLQEFDKTTDFKAFKTNEDEDGNTTDDEKGIDYTDLPF